MKELSPTMQEWERLYETAIRFKENGSWDWMDDTEIFGVKNPENGEIGYCVTLGNNREVFALVIYIGTEGLEQLLRMYSGEMDNEEALYGQKCLMASFEDRNELSKEDIQIIQKLGLKFRGRNEWPLFRNYLPGYFPWYINKKDANLLTVALEQAIEVSTQVKNNPNYLVSAKKNTILVRVLDQDAEKPTWQNKWLKPEPVPPKIDNFVVLDEIRVKRIQEKYPVKEMIWQADYFLSPSPVQDKGGRPYFPYVSMLIEENTDQIINVSLSQHSKRDQDFIETILKTMDSHKSIPRSILLKKPEARKILEPIAKQLNINVKVVKRLKLLDEAKRDMIEHFR